MIKNQQYLYPKFPPTSVVKLLQYNGSRVEHRDGFSSYKRFTMRFKNGEFQFGFSGLGKNRRVDGLQTENKMKKFKKKNSLKHWATGFRS